MTVSTAELRAGAWTVTHAQLGDQSENSVFDSMVKNVERKHEICREKEKEMLKRKSVDVD